jgi:hypothetical protein
MTIFQYIHRLERNTDESKELYNTDEYIEIFLITEEYNSLDSSVLRSTVILWIN